MRPEKRNKACRGKLTHLDGRGRARMVDIARKKVTTRIAVARVVVRMRSSTLEQILAGAMPKGDVSTIARIAAIQAAKRTFELIPLCHPIRITSVVVEPRPMPPCALELLVTVKAVDRTGAEMEAMTAAAVAGLVVYDMCKAVDRDIVLERVELLEKSGGRSGTYRRNPKSV